MKDYASLEQLLADTSIVVRVRATDGQEEVPAEAEGKDDLESTLTEVSVLETVRGETSGSTLQVRQSGSVAVVFEGNVELLRPGAEYVLFLTPFTFADRQPTGQWIITGEVGGYRLVGDEFVRVADAAPGLPRVLDLEALPSSG